LVDGVLNFPAGKRAEPYLLAGVGSANLDLDGTDDTGFAYKAGAGARLSKNLLVGVSW
jgi:opacity protein-like surface antigen